MIDDPTPAEIGARVRAARCATGLTAQEIAIRAGISKSYMSEIEHGISVPTVLIFLRLARATDTTVEALLTGVAHQPEPVDTETTRLRALVKALRAMLDTEIP